MESYSPAKKQIMLSYASMSFAIRNYEVERSYDYGSEPGFALQRVPVAAGALPCVIKINAEIYITGANPAGALEAKLISGELFSGSFDNLVFSNLSLQSYKVIESDTKKSYDVELVFVSTRTNGGIVSA